MDPILLITAGTVLFATISPFLNAAIQRVTWTPKQKALVAWGVSIVIAIIYVLLTGGIANLSQLVIAAPAIYGYQQAIYTFFLKNVATKFEAITTPGSIVVSPSETTPGKVDITTDTTIATTGTAIQADPPVQVTPVPTDTADPKPIEIIKDDVRG
jgi:hypothetical protein